jgi:serine/threonine-protein kinase
MASVYLAQDLRHERKVALKILRPELAAVIGAERFLAEIRTTANLQHPHILPLFDSGEAGGYLYYVMPYVDGETLRDKLDREKQLGVEESVRIARDVADALDYAHRHGVIHRDIKPANILLHDGRPVVSDFGIALAVSAAGGGRMTETGMSLGTPHYMSPEQASADRDLTPRSDVYSLGCVLYEMIAGQPPHTGPSAQSILVHILTRDVTPLTELRHTVPDNLAAAVARAIEKLPADRFESARAFRDALDDTGFVHDVRAGRGTATPFASTRASRPWHRDPRSLATLSALALVALWSILRGGSDASTPAVPFRTTLTDVDARAFPNSGTRIAIARDGSQIAFASVVDDTSRLFVRAAGRPGVRMIPGTEGATNFSFSPDGRWIVFANAGQIYRVEVAGGPVLPVAAGNAPHWGLDDVLVFTRASGIYRVAPFGGEPVLIAQIEGLTGNARPRLLPDGRAVVLQGPEVDSARHVWVAELPSGELTDLGVVGDNPRYLPTGHLAFGVQSQALMAVPFDLETHQVTGAPITVLPDVRVYGGGATQFDVSETGTAVYASSAGAAGERVELTLIDMAGAESVTPLGPGTYGRPRFSPDGRYLAYNDSAGVVWVWDRESGENRRLSGERVYFLPAWSRDGRSVYVAGLVEGVTDGFRWRVDGSPLPEQLFSREGPQVILGEAPNGTLLVAELTATGGSDLVSATLGPDSVTFTDYLIGPWNERNGAFSPDGARVAYVSDESGVDEVYMRPFPNPVGQLRVSENGGTDPIWAPDGSAIYYLSGGALWRAELAGGGVRERRRMFEGRWARLPNGVPVTNYDVHPDGRSFVFARLPDEDAVADDQLSSPRLELEVVVNWFEELRELFGENAYGR